jgi:hypothetical protein
MAILTLRLAEGPFASSPRLLISDAHTGLEPAIEAGLLGAPGHANKDPTYGQVRMPTRSIIRNLATDGTSRGSA